MPVWMFWGLVAAQWLTVVATIVMIGEERKPLTRLSAVIQLASAMAITALLYFYSGAFSF